MLHGDLGRAINGNRQVLSIIERSGVTIYLSLASTAMVLIFILLGGRAAFRRNSWLDRTAVMFGVFGISSPAFVTGIFLLYLGVVLGWFPTYGPWGRRSRWHPTLPMALALTIMAIVVKITRVAMIQSARPRLCDLRPRPGPRRASSRSAYATP